MIRRGKRFISPGFEYLPAQVIVQGGFHDQGHIIDSTLMVFIVKAHTICKMGGIGKAKLLQLFVHQLHKGFLRSGDIVGKAQGRIGTGGEDGAVQQFPDRNCLSHHKTYHTAVIDIGIVCDVNGHGEGIVQVFHVFCGHQKGQDLGHGGGGDDGVGVFFGQNGVITQIEDDSILAVDLVAKMNGG